MLAMGLLRATYPAMLLLSTGSLISFSCDPARNMEYISFVSLSATYMVMERALKRLRMSSRRSMRICLRLVAAWIRLVISWSALLKLRFSSSSVIWAFVSAPFWLF